MHRVLRPGGVALVLDADHATRVNSAVDPDVDRRMMELFLSKAANPTARTTRSAASGAGVLTAQEADRAEADQVAAAEAGAALVAVSLFGFVLHKRE